MKNRNTITAHPIDYEETIKGVRNAFNKVTNYRGHKLEFVVLSNGSFYFRPTEQGPYTLDLPGFVVNDLGADVLGVIVSMLAYTRLFLLGQQPSMAIVHKNLEAFSRVHPESDLIKSALRH